jgi:AcrR family transcriptional regulator
MGKRAEGVDATRRAITEAAVRLHTSVGPSATSMSAVAEEAQVTRVTLYRHFRDGEALFAACMGHWRDLHPPPDPASWSSIRPLAARVRRALADVYGWYEENGDELYPLYRDEAFTPRSTIDARRATTDRSVDALLAGVALRGRPRRRVRAMAGHMLGFWAWRSLSYDRGLRGSDVVDVATAAIMASAGSA